VLQWLYKEDGNMSSTITVRVDENIKKEAGTVLKNLGMDMSTAIIVYLKQVIRNNGIPFALSAEVPNEATLKAIKEAEAGKMASFSSIDELMEDLND
jgi:DNA-damage-inducible protein J